MSSPPLLTALAIAALSASLALLTAHLQLPRVADVLAIGGAGLGIIAFVAVAVSTVRSARRLPGRRGRP